MSLAGEAHMDKEREAGNGSPGRMASPPGGGRRPNAKPRFKPPALDVNLQELYRW
jgi:hypothetical protein